MEKKRYTLYNGTVMEYRVQRIIETIKASLTRDGRWRLPTDNLIRLLDIDPAEFYRTLYREKDNLPLFDMIDLFTDNDAGNLIALLEEIERLPLIDKKDSRSEYPPLPRRNGSRIEEAFVKAGLFIPHSDRIELMECFISEVNARLSAHSIHHEDFTSMYGVAGDFYRALDMYYAEYFSLGPMIEKACLRFIEKKHLDTTAYATVPAYLYSLFQRHIFDPRGLFLFIEKKLHSFINKNNDSEQDEKPVSDITRAKRILGLESGLITRKRLKKRYVTLMKTYHPDINPEGLEMCKRITSAYSFLRTVIS
ncbi:MAG: J domain-containing protein [Spirochaetales bacterium]|nr:J domain-containing protein [Spirochaetales bacterium]